MVKRSKNLLTYDKILDLYATDLDAGRIFLYKVIPTLAQKSPYHRYVSANHTADDIHWEMFMFLDSILTSSRTRQSKFYYLWNVFHRMHDSLNKTLKLYKEVYDESLLSSETYDIKDVDWMLEYLLDLHWVLNSAEKKVYTIITNWWWVSKVIKELHIQYKDARDLYDTVIAKIKDFLYKMDKDVTDIC